MVYSGLNCSCVVIAALHLANPHTVLEWLGLTGAVMDRGRTVKAASVNAQIDHSRTISCSAAPEQHTAHASGANQGL